SNKLKGLTFQDVSPLHFVGFMRQSRPQLFREGDILPTKVVGRVIRFPKIISIVCGNQKKPVMKGVISNDPRSESDSPSQKKQEGCLSSRYLIRRGKQTGKHEHKNPQSVFPPTQGSGGP